MTHSNSRICLILIAFSLRLSASANVTLPQFEVVFADPPRCPDTSTPSAMGRSINDHGAIVGGHCNCICFTESPFLWTEDRGYVVFDMPGGFVDGTAMDISNSGVIVGSIGGYAQPKHGFVIQDGKWTLIPPLRDCTFAELHAINEHMQAVGDTGNVIVGPGHRAILWEDGTATFLDLPMGPNSCAEDINELGQITGWMGKSTADARAYIYDQSRVTTLSPVPGGVTSFGQAINNDGDVAGFGSVVNSDTGDSFVRAFAYIDGKMINLGVLPGFEDSRAFDISDERIVVGYCSAPGEPDTAFLWQDGIMIALNDVLLEVPRSHLTSARSINAQSQITGRAFSSPTYRVTPVSALPGDASGDGAVGPGDLAIILGSWGACRSKECAADLNKDGFVGPADLAIVLGHWGL